MKQSRHCVYQKAKGAFAILFLTLHFAFVLFVRYFFDVLGIKKTDPLGFTNGILMTLSFFAVRILVMPIYWMKVYQVYGTEAFLRTGHVQMVLLVTCIVLDIINLFWFYKMLKGVHKVLRVNFDKNYNDTSRKIQ